MKKKFVVIIIIMILLITGCGKVRSKKDIKGKGELYYQVTLYDTVNGVDIFNTILPSGWKYYNESNWSVVSSSVPGFESIRLSSGDGKASIIIRSQEGFVENKKYNEGINYDYYTTYLHYMDASGYIDYFMNNYFKGSSFVKDMDIDQDLLNKLKEINSIKLELGKKDALVLSNVTPNVSVTVSENGVSSSSKQFSYGDNMVEISTSVTSLKTNLYSSLSPLLNSEAIDWVVPYTIIYQAEDLDSFNKYYDTYKFIVANSSFTVKYYAMVEYVSSYIVNLYTSIYTEKSKAALKATNDFIDSKYSSTSSSSTQDKVREMWSDVINEVDKYQLEDGGYIKTSIHNDVVAQNGDEIYIGSKGGVPYGFNILDKGY